MNFLKPMKLLAISSILLSVLLLASCASPGGSLQKAGSSADLFGLKLQTELNWTRIKGRRMELWTIDGPGLNSLFIIGNIKPGEQVLQEGKESKSRPDGAWFRAGMRPDELRAAILDAVRAQGWVAVESSNFRPHDFTGIPGIRFDVIQTSTDGLIYRGSVAAFERNGLLNVLYWRAPFEHYYPRDAVAVNAMLDSVRF